MFTGGSCPSLRLPSSGLIGSPETHRRSFCSRPSSSTYYSRNSGQNAYMKCPEIVISRKLQVGNSATLGLRGWQIIGRKLPPMIHRMNPVTPTASRGIDYLVIGAGHGGLERSGQARDDWIKLGRLSPHDRPLSPRERMILPYFPHLRSSRRNFLTTVDV